MDIKHGLNMDFEYLNMPSGSWVKGKNVIRQKGKGVKNHRGFDVEEVLDEDDDDIMGTIEIEDSVIIFTGRYVYNSTFFIKEKTSAGIVTICQTTHLSTLGLIINSTATKSKISGVYTKNYKGDRIITFFDYANKGRPLLLNIDNPPFTRDANKNIIAKEVASVEVSSVEEQVGLMFLQPEFKTPFFKIVSVSDGGSLKCGVHQYCIAYEIDTYDFTIPSIVSEPCYIGDHIHKMSDTVGYPSTTRPIVVNSVLSSDYGSFASKRIKLEIKNLDRTYSRFKLISIFKTGESEVAETIGVYDITSDSIEIDVSGLALFTESYQDVLLNKVRFSGTNSISAFQNKLSINGLSYRDDEIWVDEPNGITYQVYANGIRVKVHGELVPSGYDDSAIPTSTIVIRSTNGEMVANTSSFQPGEVYALYIGFSKGDKVSKGYHIPGREVRTNSYSNETLTDAIDILDTQDITDSAWKATLALKPTVVANNHLDLTFTPGEEAYDPNGVYFYQIRDTSSLVNNRASYWENVNEAYDESDNNSKVYDSGGDTGITLSGNVRHHKMPSYKSLLDYAGTTTNVHVRLTITIDITTLELPSCVTDEYDAVHLFYADRTYSQSTVLGMSPILSSAIGYNSYGYGSPDDLMSNVAYLRFYDFGLNAIKPNIAPSYITNEVQLQHEGEPILGFYMFGSSSLGAWRNYDIPMNLLENTNYTAIDYIRVVNGYSYLSEGDSSSDPPNILTYKVEEEYTAVNREGVLSLFSKEPDHDKSQERGSMVTDYDAVTIISEAKAVTCTQHHRLGSRIYLVPGGGTATLENTLNIGVLHSFKSSVYTNRGKQNLIQCGVSTGLNPSYPLWLRLSIPNGLRISDIQSSSTEVQYLRFTGDCFINDELLRGKCVMKLHSTGNDTFILEGDNLVRSVAFRFPNYSRVNAAFKKDPAPIKENEVYDYNAVFSHRNKENFVSPSNLEIDNIIEHNTRFTRSAALSSEAKAIGWRNFNPLEYYDFPHSAGDATYLFGGDLNIVFGFTKDTYIARIRETLDTGGGQTLALRTNNLFDTSPVRLQDSFERGIHISGLDFTFDTKDGIYIYDNVNQTLYLFNGSEAPVPISKLGLDSYLKSIAATSGIVGIYDEQTEHTFFTIDNDGTKDTWSFYLPEKQFVAKYDFRLDFAFLINQVAYGIDTSVTATSKIFKFNSGDYQKYLGTKYDSYVDLLFTDHPSLSKLIESIIYNVDVDIDGVKKWGEQR